MSKQRKPALPPKIITKPVEQRVLDGARLKRSLDLRRWGKLTLAMHIGERYTTVSGWVSGTITTPDNVLDWSDRMSAPIAGILSPAQLPEAPCWPWDESHASDMGKGEFREILELMHWMPPRSALSAFTHMRPGDDLVHAMLDGTCPVPQDLANWLRTVSRPLRDEPLPAGWERRIEYTTYVDEEGRHRRRETAIPGAPRLRHGAKPDAPPPDLGPERRLQRLLRGVPPVEELVQTRDRLERNAAEARKRSTANCTPESLERMHWLEWRAELARRLVEAGMPKADLGPRLGVTRQAVQSMLRPKRKEPLEQRLGFALQSMVPDPVAAPE